MGKRAHADLSEHRAREVELTVEQATFLRAEFGQALEVSPPVRTGTYRLAPTHYVGTIVGPDLEVRIDPKVGVQGFFYMLGYAHRLLRMRKRLAEFTETEELYEHLIAVLVAELEDLLLGGLRRGYVESEEALPVLRGRLLLGQLLRRPPGSELRLPCRFEDFTADLRINRVIRHTLERLPPPRSRVLVQRLRRLRRAFRVVSRESFRAADIDHFEYDRLTARYEHVHQLCRVLLEGTGVDQDAGSHPFGSFLVDMNALFERFVTAWFRAHLPSWVELDSQRTGYLDRERQIGIRPDLVFSVHGVERLVADTKYKILGSATPSTHDAYQMLAYCRALGIERGVLLYPAWDHGVRSFRVRDGRNTVLADGLELSSAPDETDRSMGALLRRLLLLVSSSQGHDVASSAPMADDEGQFLSGGRVFAVGSQRNG